MMSLTNRDIDILRTSSLGVANFKMLLHTLTNAYGHTISDAALLRRLSILSRAGYIARRKEPFRKKHGHFAVYGLTRQAAKVLAELGYPLERIRMGLPTTFFVRHDLNVTSILHVIHQESCRNYYKYDFLDSVVLKQYRQSLTRPDPRHPFESLFSIENRSYEHRDRYGHGAHPQNAPAYCNTVQDRRVHPGDVSHQDTPTKSA
jgi:DNA-binding HxlR family transcriptional regulator